MLELVKNILRDGRLVLSICLLSSSVIVISASSSPLTGYELNLYESLMPFGWAAVGLGLVIGYIGFLISITRDSYMGAGAAIVGVTSITGTVVLLPLFRGYHRYGRGDMSTIIGHLRVAMAQGQVGARDYYPAFNLNVTHLHSVTTVDINQTMLLFSFLLTILSPLFVYCLARTIFSTSTGPIISSVFATPLYFSYRYVNALYDPQALTLLATPLLIFLLLSAYKGRRRAKLPLFLITVLLPFLHPVPTLVFFLSLIVSVTCMLIAEYKTADNSQFWGRRITITRNLIVILLLATVAWYTYTRFFGINILRIYTALQGISEASPAGRNVSTLSRIRITELLSLFIRRFGSVFVLVVLSGLGFLLVNSNRGSRERFLPLSTWIIVASCMEIGIIVFRALPLFIFRLVGGIASVAHTFAGALFVRGFRQDTTITGVILVCTLLITSSLGMVSAHPSPYTNKVSYGVPSSQLDAVDWTVSHTNSDAMLKSIETRPSRFAERLYGSEVIRDRDIFSRGGGASFQYLLPSHFEMPRNSEDEQTAQVFAFFSPVERHKVRQSSGDGSEYTPEDYRRFVSNPDVAKVYDNGDTHWFYIDLID